MGQIRGLTLKEADRSELERWARSQALPYRQVQRARILLALAEGQALAMVGAVEDTVATWRERYQAEGLAGLCDQPRRGCP